MIYNALEKNLFDFRELTLKTSIRKALLQWGFSLTFHAQPDFLNVIIGDQKKRGNDHNKEILALSMSSFVESIEPADHQVTWADICRDSNDVLWVPYIYGSWDQDNFQVTPIVH